MNKCPCCGGPSAYYDPKEKCDFCQEIPPTEEWPYFHCDPQFTGHEGPPKRIACLFDVMTGRLQP